jgi:hypothetical protein
MPSQKSKSQTQLRPHLCLTQLTRLGTRLGTVLRDEERYRDRLWQLRPSSHASFVPYNRKPQLQLGFGLENAGSETWKTTDLSQSMTDR